MAFIDFTPQEDGFVDFNKPAKLDPRDSQSDFMTGLKDTFKQLPELGWGIASITASGIESLAGEGGLATAAKNFSVNKYQDWQKDIAATHKDAYDFDKAYDSATKEGNFGALVDFLQYGVGYAVGQGAQVLATAGVGKVIGQLAIKPAVEKMAAGLVAKQAVKIAGEGASAEAIAAATPAAIKEIAGTIGQHAAMAAYSFGMEGGEIGGDLAEKSVKENRALTSGELMRGLGATMLAGTMEYGENLIGLAGMKGKLPSPFSATEGVGGRIVRAATGALVAAPVEGVTEYGQTIAEEYGKGNEQTLNPFSISAATHKQGINAAALGVVGGAVHAGGGGLISGPSPSPQDVLAAKTADEASAKALASVGAKLESDLGSAADAVSDMLDQQQFQQAMARPDPIAATFTASPVDLTPGGVAQDAAPVSADDAYAQAAQAEDKARRIAAYAAQQSNAGGDPVALAITQADAANARQAAIEDNPPIETAMQREIRKLRELQAARKESQNGAIPDATDAEMDTPSAQAKSGKLPGGAIVSPSVPVGNAGAISSSAEVAASSVRPSVSTGDASASGVKNQPEQAKQSAAKVAPNKKRNDLVGAILRVTGGDGLSPSMALDTTGDNASGATKLRGLFTNKGTTDLGEVAQRLREEEGYSVRDGEHLAELIRKQASGERVTSSSSIEEAAAEAENAAWRNNVTEEARSMGLKGPGGKRTIEMVDADIRRVMAERSAMNASEARVAAQAESMFADGQDMTEADLMRWFAQPANYTEEDINNAEQYQADREDARDAANAAIDSEVAAQSRTGERAENGRAQEGTRATNEGLTLTGQTNDQASAEYRAQQEEANRKDEAPASPTVKADQIDLFNTQGSVFDQPPAAQNSPAKQDNQQNSVENSAKPAVETPATVRDANERESSVAAKATPMLDLNKRPTGWKQVSLPNGDGVLLVSEDGKKAITFASKNKRSGTEAIRANANARAFAIDNPYSIETPKGELVVKPIFNSPDVSQKAEKPDTSTEPVQKTPENEQVEPAAPMTIEKTQAAMEPAWDAFADFWNSLIEGKGSISDVQESFSTILDRADEFKATISKLKNDQLKRMIGGWARLDMKKADLVERVYDSTLTRFMLNKEIPSKRWIYGENMADVDKAYNEQLRMIVNGLTDADLAEFRDKISENTKERKEALEEKKAAVADPKTLEDFNLYLTYSQNTGKTRQEAYQALTSEQKALWDSLAADKTRSERASRKDAQQSTVSVASQTTGTSEIIKGKHTKHGHDLYILNLTERVTPEAFKELLAQSKKLGGDYSSYRGNGATPGWQFRTQDGAEAFAKLVSGDTSQAQAVTQARRDAYADDRSQSAVERLNEMADRLEESADASTNQERKANTARRARFAASAEAAASNQSALAATMRNIAGAIDTGAAKFLDRVRQKVQIELLQDSLRTAKDNELRAKYPSYADREKHRGEPATSETAEYATWPSYTLYRSDLANLGRKLLDVDGTKKLGQQILKVADDVTDTYLAFAKANLNQVMKFSTKDGGLAAFPTKDAAETAIARSGFNGKAIAYQVKRGEHTIIYSPTEAQERGVWKGDGDEKITFKPEFGAELVEKLARKNRSRELVAVPWQFQNTYDRRKRLAGMGIETNAEFRTALREFAALREAPKEADKIKAMERAMIGRKNDGLDFFPTPASTAQAMIDAADIKEGMSVLEPSAGMGHIAEQIREAGAEPDVVEMANDRKELLDEKGFNVVGRDFMDVAEQYDRIIMNPPFSDRRDAEHVQHAFTLLRPGGRLVALMGEGVFFGQDKKAVAFREWLDSVGGTSEKLEEGTFLDPSLPVNTGVNARMIVVDRPADDTGETKFRPRSEQLIADGDLEGLANQTFPDIDGSDTNQGATKPEPLPDAPMADNRTAAYTIQKTLAAKIGSVPAITIHTGMAPAGTISRSTFKAINAVAKIFKQRVVYFQSDRATVDGFVQDGVVYLNVDSSVSPLAVMGHELTHRLQQEQPEAWHAVAQVLAGRMDQAKLLAMYRSYNGGTMTDAQIIEQLQDEKALEDLMAEMVSDYAGNQFTDETFWGDVFGQIASAHPEGMAKRLIERLRTAVMKMVGLMNKAINQPGFAKTWLVGEENTAELGKDVNAALKTAYAQWIDAISQDGYQAVQEAAAAKFSPGWHGSPYDHDKFDMSKVGTGEGNQAYGFGLYFADAREVAEYYRSTLGGFKVDVRGELEEAFPDRHFTTKERSEVFASSVGSVSADPIDSAARKLGYRQASLRDIDQSKLTEVIKSLRDKGRGRLYQVDLKPAEDEYLLWDKPLTEQSEKVKAAILDAAGRLSSPDALSGSSWATGGWGKGESFYKKLSGEVGGDKAASKYLHSIGIRGIRYLDGSSRDLSGTQWKEGADPTQYHKLTKGVAENYLRERGDVADAIARLNRDAEASGAKQYADAAKALESGDLVQKLNHNYVIFDDKDVTIEAKFSNRRNDTEAPTSAGDGSTESATKIPAPEIPRKLSQKQFEGILQDIDGYGPIEADDPYRIQEFRSIVKRLKSAGVDFIDMYHVTDASLKEFDSDGILGSSVSDIGRPGVNERDSSVYGFLDPDDIKKSYNGILGSSSETPNVVHIKVPVDRIGDLRWDGNFNVTYGAYSGIRFIGDIPSNWISGIYSHAIKNEPSTSAGSAKFSTARIVGDSGRTYTPEQQAMFKVTGREVNDLTTLEKLKQWTSKKWVQGIVDQFAPIKDIDLHAYTLTRLSKGATGAFEAFMGHGKLSIKDGAYDADTSGGVMQEVFFPLGKETTDFLYWIAGNRAERLAAEGKERLFSRADIDAAKSLAAGTADFDYTLQNGNVTRDRTKIYADSLVKFNEFNKNIMDMAEQSGLIDGASRHLWEHEFYVPFYRLADDKDGGVRGMNIKKGVVRQQAFKKLKGGTEGLNDLLANTLMNWAHLIDASAKNRAAKATLDAAQAIGISRPVAANMAQYAASNGAMLPPGTKNTVWYSDKGNKQEFTVDDPHLIIALNGLDFSGLRGPVMDALSKTKHWLTIGVTASPFFKIRNLIRDSVQAVGTSGLGYNVFANVAEGARLTNRDNAEYVSALAGGGLIRFGTMLENNEAARARQLIKKGAKDSHILDNESKVRQFYDKFLSPGVSAYNELGNRGEDINRMALYHQLMKQGMSHADASLQARDLMDFSMQGSFTTIRFLTQTVPFMNARLQGLHKLGRAAKEDPAKFAIVTGMVALASLALLAAYGDDDDWKKREDWDRDNYWWFKFGGEAFRIPKPFEIGAIGTLAERSAEYISDKEMTGKRFAKVTSDLVWSQLAMNPVPQMVKPIVDIYSNKDSFSGRPIETMGMEKLDKEYRFNANTSMVARGLSTGTGGALSPVQIDSLVRGYFSWLGTFAVGTADLAVRAASNEPTRPTLDYWKLATGGMVADLDSGSSRYVSQMYEQAKILEEAHGTLNALRKQGKTAEAQEYLEDNKEKLQKYSQVEHVKKSEAKLSERIRVIERSNMQPDEKRDLVIQIRKQQDQLARRVN